MYSTLLCLILCSIIYIPNSNTLEDNNLIWDVADNSTFVHNVKRRDVQSKTVGCQFDNSTKLMYYYVKFGRYRSWLFQDKIEIVVRYSENETIAGQKVPESQVLMFDQHSAPTFQEIYENGGYYCCRPGWPKNGKGCPGCHMMCLYFNGTQYNVADGTLDFSVSIFLGKCRRSFRWSESPPIQQCIDEIEQTTLCPVRQFSLYQTEYYW